MSALMRLLLAAVLRSLVSDHARLRRSSCSIAALGYDGRIILFILLPRSRLLRARYVILVVLTARRITFAGDFTVLLLLG